VPRLIARGGALVLVTALGLFAPGCGRSLDGDECLKLLDHYTELLVREEDPDAPPERVAHLKERARDAARTDPRFEFGECPRKVSRRSYECAMQALDVDSVERCLVF
jgi:hypothetical protein